MVRKANLERVTKETDIKVNTKSLDTAECLKLDFKVEFKKIENMILTYVLKSDKTK